MRMRQKAAVVAVSMSVMLQLTACGGPKISDEPIYVRYMTIDSLNKFENGMGGSACTKEVVSEYEKYVTAEERIQGDIPFYQKQLADGISEVQQSGAAVLPKTAAYAFSDIFALKLRAELAAHRAIANCFMSEGNIEGAITHVEQSAELVRARSNAPYFRSLEMIKTYDLLGDLYEKKGSVGKALITRMTSSLLRDHLASEGGTDDYYMERVLFSGEIAKKQFRMAQDFVHGVNAYRMGMHVQQAMAMAGAMNQMNAQFQQAAASSALARSGGVMTPQAQMAQLNASLSSFTAQAFQNAAKMMAASPASLKADQTPWAVPSFAQQLVDPKQGANTPTIMKGFATSAAQAGGASYQAGAQQVTQAVEALAPYRQSGKMDGAAAQVEKFAEVFNAFLTQVQEIRK